MGIAAVGACPRRNANTPCMQGLHAAVLQVKLLDELVRQVKVTACGPCHLEKHLVRDAGRR